MLSALRFPLLVLLVRRAGGEDRERDGEERKKFSGTAGEQAGNRKKRRIV